MPFLPVAGLTLHYRHDPAPAGRPTVVFSNSLGTDFRIWQAVIDALGPGYGYLLYDKRGHGLSDLGETPYTIATHAGDLAGLMDALGLRGAVICGLSVGGMIAQHLAAVRPDLTRALVLCDTAHRIGTPEMWQARLESLRRGGIAAVADGVLERWFTPPFRSGDAAFPGCRNMLLRQPAEGYIATCEALRDADLTATTARLALPVLCVAGDQDGSTPPEVVRSMADLIAGSRFHVIEGCGHIPCVEQPARLARLMADFLAGL